MSKRDKLQTKLNALDCFVTEALKIVSEYADATNRALLYHHERLRRLEGENYEPIPADREEATITHD